MLRGRAVAGAAREGEGWSVRLAGGARLPARSVVLATGKHELRGHARAALQRIADLPRLSRNTSEMVTRLLAAGG